MARVKRYEEYLPAEEQDARTVIKMDRLRKKTRKGDLAGNTFEDLTNPEKDKLLKALAVQAGLIDDSDDS